MTTRGADIDPFDFIDDDWIETVVKVAAELPDCRVSVIPGETADNRRIRNKSYGKMREMAARTRKKSAK